MKTNNTVRVSKFWPVTYKNSEGQQTSTKIIPTGEYLVKLNSGSEFYAMFSGYTQEKKPDGKKMLKTSMRLHEGFFNVVEESTDQIDLNDVVSIERMNSKYRRSTRTMKTITLDKDRRSFSFAFDPKKPGMHPYRISIYEGEFVSIVYHDDATNQSVTMYGEITDVTDDSIIFTQYTASGGYRGLKSDIEIAAENLIGIYRYELGFTTFENTARKNTEDKSAKETKDESTDTPTESESTADTSAQ